MAKSEPNNAAILVATDNITDADLVRKLLAEEFENIFTTTDADKAAADFERRRPGVLVLAFKSMEKAERYYLGLYRLCPAVQQIPHRTVILCSKDDVKRVYDLCKKHYFDEYVLFWPMTYDMSRLAMAVHHVLRELAVALDGGPSVAEFAAQARRLAQAESLLARSLADGGQHIAVSRRAMEQAEQDVGAALDGFTRRLIAGALPDAVTVNNADALTQEVSRLKREEVGERFRTAAESARPLTQWADEFKQEFSAHTASVRELNTLAERVQPTVLIVDDDEFQHKIVAKILEAENCHLIFAVNGFEALGLLRRTRPDLILMDVMMRDMDGIEVTRRLKAVPQFAGIPIIMVTGKNEKHVVTESLKAGATGFVVKPFHRDTLITKVKQALNSAKPA